MSSKQDKTHKQDSEAEKNNFEDLYKRALADYHNLQKQTVKEREEFADYIKGSLIMNFLPVYENLKAAINHADKNNHDNWLQGIMYVVKQFEDVLVSNGTVIINPVNEEFNPIEHEAIKRIKTNNENENNKIAKVVQEGYKMGDRIIQAAKVEVYVHE